VVWLILFGLLASRSPETHPYISRAERDHIVGTRRATLGDAGAASGFCEVPWTAFFRHPPFWGTVTAHFCYNYMSFLALSLGARQHQNTSFGPFCTSLRFKCHPLYAKRGSILFWGVDQKKKKKRRRPWTSHAVLCVPRCTAAGPYFFQTKYGVDISSPSSGLGAVSCLPYIVLFVAQGIAGMVADWLANTGRLSMTRVRKLFNTLGLLFAATFFGLLASPIVQHGQCG